MENHHVAALGIAVDVGKAGADHSGFRHNGGDHGAGWYAAVGNHKVVEHKGNRHSGYNDLNPADNLRLPAKRLILCLFFI